MPLGSVPVPRSAKILEAKEIKWARVVVKHGAGCQCAQLKGRPKPISTQVPDAIKSGVR
jgi:hypothetical protein